MGGTVQEASDLSGTAYEIENSQGERSIVRSPNARFTPRAEGLLRKARVSSRNLIDRRHLIPGTSNMYRH